MFLNENVIVVLRSFSISKIIFVATFKVEVAPNKRYPGLSVVRILVSNETAAFGERAEGRHYISECNNQIPCLCNICSKFVLGSCFKPYSPQTSE